MTEERGGQVPEQLVEEYRERVDRLFCRRNSPFPGYLQIDAPTVLVPGLLSRATLQHTGQGNEAERFQLTLFEGIDGFAGELGGGRLSRCCDYAR